MKILVNSQDKKVGGIVRMMQVFLTTLARISPHTEVHLVVASSGPVQTSLEGERSQRELYGYPVDQIVFPSGWYMQALEQSNTIEDLRSRMRPLIEFYEDVIDHVRPHVVLVNGMYYRPWALMQAAQRKNIPMVIFVHGSVVEEAKGASEKVVSILRSMEKEFDHADRQYIFPSALARSSIPFAAESADQRFHVIPNALDDRFFAGPHEPTVAPMKVGFVLRWEPVKNTQFIQEFSAWNDQQQDPFEISIVSDLNAQQSSLLETPHTHFLDPLDAHQMISYYRSLDVLVNPSFFETFGYVPAEAVACGTPAIVTSRQGIAEVFRRCGLERLIHDLNTPSELASYIRSLHNAPLTAYEIQQLQSLVHPDVITRHILSVLETQSQRLHV